MKRLLRSSLVQAALSRVVQAYVELIIATLRWRIVDREPADAALLGDEGLIALFWHGRIAHAMACRPLLGSKPRRVLISLSRDGDFIARAAALLGVPTIRGSTGRSEEIWAKGGTSAFRAAVAVIQGGGAMLLTPDGPRGPRHVVQAGPVTMARAAGCPVFVMGLSARPSLPLGSWDQGRLPLPFARAVLVLDGPFFARRAADRTSLEATRLLWNERINAAQASAESLLGL